MNMFYWIAVHHWQHGNEEKIFEYSKSGMNALQVYMWDKVHNGWSVVQLKLMNRRNDV